MLASASCESGLGSSGTQASSAMPTKHHISGILLGSAGGDITLFAHMFGGQQEDG